MTEARTTKSHKILVVDDTDSMRVSIVRQLKVYGFDVVSAEHGLEGLRLARQEKPDLILSDIMMPEMDGIEMTSTLRTYPEFESIPILVLTALPDLKKKVAAFDAGADDFIPKPYDDIELLARVRSHLRLKDMRDKLRESNALLDKVLTQYVAADVAREILKDPEHNLQLGGENCIVSVLFADICGFTDFATRHAPGDVLASLNTIYKQIVPFIFDAGGTVDKFLGDAVMANFGIPKRHVQDPVHAVRAGCKMLEAFVALRSDNPVLAGLDLSVGIATGQAVVGNVGTERLKDYTVIGNVPNTAKRLEESAARGELLVDTATFDFVRSQVNAEQASQIEVVGEQDLVQAYRIHSFIDV